MKQRLTQKYIKTTKLPCQACGDVARRSVKVKIESGKYKDLLAVTCMKPSCIIEASHGRFKRALKLADQRQ